jgi:hypothetical protein
MRLAYRSYLGQHPHRPPGTALLAKTAYAPRSRRRYHNRRHLLLGRTLLSVGIGAAVHVTLVNLL